MHRLRILFGIAAALLSLALFATELPWKKPPAEWSKEDALAILRDSPWVHNVTLNTTPVISSGRGIAETRGGMPRNQVENEEIAITASGRRSPTSNDIYQPPRDSRPSGPTLDVTVRWLSSQTLRQAITRHRELKGLPKDAAALGIFALHYTIGISGHRVGSLKPGTTPYLELHPGNEKILPEGIELLQTHAAATVAEVLIYFPRAVDGKPLLEPNVEKVRFVCEYQIGQRSFHVKTDFDPRKMTRNGAPDL